MTSLWPHRPTLEVLCIVDWVIREVEAVSKRVRLDIHFKMHNMRFKGFREQDAGSFEKTQSVGSSDDAGGPAINKEVLVLIGYIRSLGI
jgi:hypothetical protein